MNTLAVRAWHVVGCVVAMVSVLAFVPAGAQNANSGVRLEPLAIAPEDQLAADNASDVRLHLLLTHSAAARGISRDWPPRATSRRTAAQSVSSTAIADAPQPSFFPADVGLPGKTGVTVANAQSHAVFVNCPAANCWGDPVQFLTDLGQSTFIHLVDQYVGLTTDGRYTVGTGFLAPLTIIPNPAGVPTVPQSQVIALVHAAAMRAGTGFTHVYHVFLPKGVNTCDDQGNCYSPDDPATFVFCAYHSIANFADLGEVLYTVEPFQGVPRCEVVGPAPNGVLADSTDSTLSHEVFETITDPDLATGFVALFSGAVTGDEIGDLCGGVLNPVVTLNGRNYAVQLEYSNTFHACASTP